MAGLLDGVLPWVYSRGNALNRGVTGLLSDPLGSMEQTAGLLADYRREDDRLNKLVFADPKTVSKSERDGALNQLAARMLSGPVGFAPVGMTTFKRQAENFGSNNQLLREKYSGGKADMQLTTYPNGARVVNEAHVDPALRGKGMGQEMYLRALEDGPITVREQFRSADAARVYDALIRKGLAEIKNGQLVLKSP